MKLYLLNTCIYCACAVIWDVPGLRWRLHPPRSRSSYESSEIRMMNSCVRTMCMYFCVDKYVTEIYVELILVVVCNR